MRVLFLTRYDYMGASSRQRVYQFLDHLRSEGFHYRVIPLFHGGLAEKAKYFLHVLKSASWADVVWLQKVYFRPLWINILAAVNPTLVFDYDDAMFAAPDTGVNCGTIEQYEADEEKVLAHTLRMSKQVIAGNVYLQEYALQYNQNVIVIPTSVDLSRYSMKKHCKKDNGVIGWIGSPATVVYIDIIRHAFEEIGRQCPDHVILKIVGAELPWQVKGLQIICKPWQLDSEIEDLLTFDVGIMPLTDSKRARGKCGFKAIQYMAAGIPPVCSPIGASLELVENGVTGYLADSTDQWVEKLLMLLRDASLRREIGCQGRQLVKQRYCKQVIAPTITNIIRIAATRRDSR